MDNIIELLSKGNQELFHSTMIAFLLDPNESHKLGRALLDKLFPNLGEVIKIETDKKDGKNRYDIVINENGEEKVKIENKIKTLGNILQVKKYKNNEVDVVGLGLLEENFDKESRESKEFRIITYREIIDIIPENFFSREENKFQILVSDYLKYLKKEYELLDLIKDSYWEGNNKNLDMVNEEIKKRNFNQNHIRYLHYIHLNKLSEELQKYNWIIKKNEGSGVWMANYKQEKDYFNSKMRKLIEKHECKFWFHIEIKKDLFSSKGDIVGDIQLRCEKKGDKTALENEFEKEMGFTRNKISSKYNSFYMKKDDLKREHLVIKELKRLFEDFSSTFVN